MGRSAIAMARTGWSSLLLFWSAVACLVVHNAADPGSESLLKESLDVDGQVDVWEASGQPISARKTDDWDLRMCLDASGSAKACQAGDTKQEWVYKRLHGGTITNVAGTKCITRKGSTITADSCNDGAGQKWKRLCGAWANGGGNSGRVLEFTGKEGEAEAKVRGAQWTGDSNQLWNFKEIVHHTACDKKAHKVMSFDGTTASTVALRSFLSMPAKLMTVGVWVKGSSGTPFSYASKHHVKAFVVSNLKAVKVYVKDHEVNTGLNFSSDKWVHLAVSWNSGSGVVKVFRDGKKVFEKGGVMQGKSITQGGCIWLGQQQATYCKTHDASKAFKGDLIDTQVWREEFSEEQVEKMMTHPVDRAILDKLGKTTQLKTPNNQRVAFLSRQYNAEEMARPSPEVCAMDAFKKKDTPKLPKVGGNMRTFSGQGDVHYRNMNTNGHQCHFDDQSVGEWVLAVVKPKFYSASPLMIQFRTSPSFANSCPWCQNGAVSYIDGCAIKLGNEQVSAGFGGFRYNGVPGLDGAGPGQYQPYGAFDGKSFSGHKRGKNLEAWRSTGSLKVKGLSDGIQLYCRKYYISLILPNTFKGKVAGLAGTGLGSKHDWEQGPNTKAYAAGKPGQQMPGLANQCRSHYVYGNRADVFNGNSPAKPLYKWFRSWQVDGEQIPSVFYYSGSTGPGSFNRNAGKKVKTIKNVNDFPSKEKRAAMAECKLLRETPEARTKCVFDFMVLGAKAVKRSQRDRMAQRASKIKTPTVHEVRDVTTFGNDGMWAGKPGWGCGDDFVAMQKALAIQHEGMWASRKATRRQSQAEAEAGCPTGFKVIAEQTDAQAQETKKCSGGFVALTMSEIKKGEKAQEKKDEEKAEGENGKKEKPAFWADGNLGVHTEMLNDNCFGIGCVKAPLKEAPGVCKDPEFTHLSKDSKKMCFKVSKPADKPNCKDWCCVDDSCPNMCKSCKTNVASEPEFASASGTAIFTSGRPVNKDMSTKDDLGEASSGSRALMAIPASTQMIGDPQGFLGESLSSRAEAKARSSDAQECHDENRDKTLTCDQIKGACETELVQSMCAATCGTPWAGSSECKAKASAERKYQCKPAAVCKVASTDAELPRGYTWLVRPEEDAEGARRRLLADPVPGHCKPKTSYGLAMCNQGPRKEASYKVAGKVKKFQVRCGCDGGFEMITRTKTTVDDECTGVAQISRGNLTTELINVYEDVEAKSAAWVHACSELKVSKSPFKSAPFPLQPIKTKAKTLNYFTAPWRMRLLHTGRVIANTDDDKCKLSFAKSLWSCDTGPMRDVALYIPGRGYNSMKVGCGCQQIRVQASYSGKVLQMSDTSDETQGTCAAHFAASHTQFQMEEWSGYREQAQKLADEIERACKKTTLELNNLAAKEAKKVTTTKLLLEENSAHLGKLGGLEYKLKLQETHDKLEINKCKKAHFVIEGLPMYERKTKELAKTADKKRAKKLRKELIKLKATLNAHQASKFVAGK